MKKIILFSVYIFIALSSYAQIKEVEIQAAGLTCSMCSKAIYKSLEKVPFVQTVTSNIKQSSYTVTFKENANVDFDVLVKAVTNAGFSVTKMLATIYFNNVGIENDKHVSIDNKTLHFINVKKQNLNGLQTLTLIDKNYVDKDLYKKYSKLTTYKCYQTGTMQSCCSIKEAQRIYHATLM